MQAKSVQVIQASSILGLQPTGVEKASSTFLKEGFLSEQIKENPVLTVVNLNHKYSTKRNKSSVLNEEALHQFSSRLLDTVLSVIQQSEFPIVLGGDCSILLGIMPAVKLYNSSAGLITFDGHADFYYPKESTGEAADMDVALVSG